MQTYKILCLCWFFFLSIFTYKHILVWVFFLFFFFCFGFLGNFFLLLLFFYESKNHYSYRCGPFSSLKVWHISQNLLFYWVFYAKNLSPHSIAGWCEKTPSYQVCFQHRRIHTKNANATNKRDLSPITLQYLCLWKAIISIIYVTYLYLREQKGKVYNGINANYLLQQQDLQP